MTVQKPVSIVALIVIVVACLLFFYGMIGQNVMNWIVLAATIAWFVTAPMWIGKQSPVIADEVEV